MLFRVQILNPTIELTWENLVMCSQQLITTSQVNLTSHRNPTLILIKVPQILYIRGLVVKPYHSIYMEHTHLHFRLFGQFI